MILAILNLYFSLMPPSTFSLLFGRRCCLKNFKMAAMESHLEHRNRTILAIPNLHVSPVPQEQMSLDDFQGGRHGGHLKYRNGTILVIQNLYVTLMPPTTSLGSIQLIVWEEMSFQEFKDVRRDGHLGYSKETILAILTLHVSPHAPNQVSA